MNISQINPQFVNVIKVISTAVISIAMGLEIWKIYAITNDISVPQSLNIFFWMGRIAIGSHFVEAIIAGFYAPGKNQHPIKYAVYTFFTGTVGLMELFPAKDSES
jgi:hypothetical protein